MQEQISEELANELLDIMFKSLATEGDSILKIWRQKGYIKQSREEEIREKLNNYFVEKSKNSFPMNEEYLKLALELIEILDKKVNNE